MSNSGKIHIVWDSKQNVKVKPAKTKKRAPKKVNPKKEPSVIPMGILRNLGFIVIDHLIEKRPLDRARQIKHLELTRDLVGILYNSIDMRLRAEKLEEASMMAQSTNHGTCKFVAHVPLIPVSSTS